MRSIILVCASILFAATFAAAMVSNDHVAKLLTGELRLTSDLQLSDADHDTLFRAFTKHFNKKYTTENMLVYKHRLSVFSDNIKRVYKMNAKQNMTTYGITQFMDLEPEEWKSIYLSKRMPLEMRQIPRMEKVDTSDPLPQEWDWRKHGAVTGVKDQGQCGSCWAFSTTGNIEGQWFLAGHNLTSLSEQQLVDCDHECEPDAPKDCDAGCDGGLMDNAFRWIIKNKGIATEQSYPYHGYDRRCDTSSKVLLGAQINNFTMLPKNESQIQSYLYSHGPISIAINADPLQYYQSGIVSGSCNPNELNHGVLITGWGWQKPWWIFKGFSWWTIKNSWSSGWGEAGYFRLSYGNNECGITEFALSSIINK